MIKCSVCGYDNQLGRVHCIQCGTKIDMAKAVPPEHTIGAKGEVIIKRRIKPPGKTSLLRAIWKTIDLVILAALGIGIMLMWQEPMIRDIPVDAMQAVAAQAKVDTLTRSAQSGKLATVELTEAEINSYMNHSGSPRRIEYAEDVPDAAFLSRLTKYQIQLGTNQFTVIGVGEVRLSQFTKRVILWLDGCAVEKPGGQQMKFTQAFIGKLPLHSLPGGQTLVNLFAEYFFRLQLMDAEWKLIKGARSLQLTPGRAVIAVGPPAVAPAAGAPTPAGS